MAIETTCPRCQQRFKVADEHLGRSARCKKCNAKFRIAPGGGSLISEAMVSTRPARSPDAQAPLDRRTDVTQPMTTNREMVFSDGVQVGATVPADSVTASRGQVDAEAAQAGKDAVPAVWDVGDVILDTYDVKHVHEGGGMGLVYRVHHRDWDQAMAVKSPRPEYFATEAHKENFVRECLTWVGLGLHPNIVCCYYVRVLGGIPRVFAEYVEGGSLKEWIEGRKLYEGGHERSRARMLDIAIQFAWGLHYAHAKGLIHQDIKPANVMMSPDGTPKVTDFGLAQVTRQQRF